MGPCLPHGPGGRSASRPRAGQPSAGAGADRRSRPVPAGRRGPPAVSSGWRDAQRRPSRRDRSGETSMPGMNLTREEARQRAAHLAVSSYHVDLDFSAPGETFASTTRVQFTSSRPGSDTFIDLVAPQVRRVVLNGRELDPAEVADGVRVRLPGLAAENELLVEACGAYMRTGEGLHRFVDPVDQGVYLYTHFEIADARRVFAVFDQPDLKASFAFSVTAPASWQVVSNSPTPVPADPGPDAAPGSATWRFAPTPRISSYITAIVAGPVPRRTRRAHQPRRAHDPARGLLPGVAGRAPRGRRGHGRHASRVRLLRACLRPRLPVRQVRPAVRPRVQRRRDGERGRGHDHRHATSSAPGFRDAARERRADHDPA